MRGPPLVLIVVAGAACGGGGSDGVDADPFDRDGDGVLDEVDNCPGYPNPDQHDEDADGLGDRCDNCPQIANPAQLDNGELQAVPAQFADHVGDACDPRPAWGGDELEVFLSFADPAVASLFDLSGGTWTVTADTLTLVPSGGVDELMMRRQALGDGLTVAAALRVDDATAPADMVLELAADGHRCTVVGAVTGSRLELVAETGESQMMTFTTPVAIGATVRLQLNRQLDAQHRTYLGCTAVVDDVTTEVGLVAGETLAVGIGFLRAKAATLTVPWLVIYTAPFGCMLIAPGRLPACPT